MSSGKDAVDKRSALNHRKLGMKDGVIAVASGS